MRKLLYVFFFSFFYTCHVLLIKPTTKILNGCLKHCRSFITVEDPLTMTSSADFDLNWSFLYYNSKLQWKLKTIKVRITEFEQNYDFYWNDLVHRTTATRNLNTNLVKYCEYWKYTSTEKDPDKKKKGYSYSVAYCE